MLRYAAHETSLDHLQNQPYLARYVRDWGRYGDGGLVATLGKSCIGAVWFRLWLANDRGFGYISDTIPELAIAVLPEYRGQGVGTKLLTQLVESVSDSFPALCLNVRSDNPAINLYKRLGFFKVEGSEVVNRTGSISFNMVKIFSKLEN
jgi:ribosomal protein S18 acetylase RimI-like enzyme